LTISLPEKTSLTKKNKAEATASRITKITTNLKSLFFATTSPPFLSFRFFS
jgi:hypothetical protein